MTLGTDLMNNELLHVTTRANTLELAIVCEVVSAEAGNRLQAHFERAVAGRDRQAVRVRLDVSSVLAMSSAGFEALLRLHRTCRDAGVELCMTQPTAEFMGLLVRMGFDRLFAIESRVAT